MNKQDGIGKEKDKVPIDIFDERNGNKISGQLIKNQVDGNLLIEGNGKKILIPFIEGKINGSIKINDNEYVSMENGILNGESKIGGMKLFFENGLLKRKEVI